MNTARPYTPSTFDATLLAMGPLSTSEQRLIDTVNTLARQVTTLRLAAKPVLARLDIEAAEKEDGAVFLCAALRSDLRKALGESVDWSC